MITIIYIVTIVVIRHHKDLWTDRLRRAVSRVISVMAKLWLAFASVIAKENVCTLLGTALLALHESSGSLWPQCIF